MSTSERRVVRYRIRLDRADAGSPTQVLEAESSDLDRAQPEPREQQQDR
jgi:hypothetical protein